jgi:hypothetical protein
VNSDPSKGSSSSGGLGPVLSAGQRGEGDVDDDGGGGGGLSDSPPVASSCRGSSSSGNINDGGWAEPFGSGSMGSNISSSQSHALASKATQDASSVSSVEETQQQSPLPVEKKQRDNGDNGEGHGKRQQPLLSALNNSTREKGTRDSPVLHPLALPVLSPACLPPISPVLKGRPARP